MGLNLLKSGVRLLEKRDKYIGVDVKKWESER